MSAVVSLERDVQHLIELRLDLLDRILMDSGVIRTERAEIVQSVEDQILEMIEQRGDETTRETVLQVLRSLDPPEAYWSEAGRDEYRDRTYRAVRREALSDLRQRPEPYQIEAARHSGLAIASLVLAIVSIPTFFLFPLGSVFSLIGLICAVIAFPQIASSAGRLKGNWMAIFSCSVFGLHAMLGVWILANM